MIRRRPAASKPVPVTTDVTPAALGAAYPKQPTLYDAAFTFLAERFPNEDAGWRSAAARALLRRIERRPLPLAELESELTRALAPGVRRSKTIGPHGHSAATRRRRIDP